MTKVDYDRSQYIEIDSQDEKEVMKSTTSVESHETDVIINDLPTKSYQSRRYQWFTVPFVINFISGIILICIYEVLNSDIIPPNQLGFYCRDPKLAFKYKGELISLNFVVLGSYILPLSVLLLAEILLRRGIKNINFWEIWYYLRVFTVGFVVVHIFVGVFKLLVGEPRPHFFDVCAPDTGKTCQLNEYVQTFRCTNEKYSTMMHMDNLKSFLSGHATVSWYSGFFTTYLVQSKLSCLSSGLMLNGLLTLICFTWSIVCSVTRITDRRHHWWDVVAGAVLGIAIAFYTITLIRKKLSEEQEKKEELLRISKIP